MKEGHWKSKNCNIDYILTKENFINEKLDGKLDYYYKLICIQTKNIHYIKRDRERLFLENTTFVKSIEEVYSSYLNNSKTFLNINFSEEEDF